MQLPLSLISQFVTITAKPEILAEKLQLSGTKVEEIEKRDGETIFHLEITPNRPDTLCAVGIARELAAATHKELALTKWEPPLLRKNSVKINFEVKNKKLCPYYSYVILNNIEVGPSPKWLSRFLSLSGVRSLNNCIDITNFVMLELGQPMHAFDLDKIKGNLVLRASKKGEEIVTLDGTKHKLEEGSIIIEDEEKIIDLAGLMGGKNSEIDNSTKRIFLMVPVYDPVTIRKTSLHTNLRTEASNRFEKKLDPNLHPLALNRAVNLFIEEASANVASETKTVGYPVPERSIEFPTKLVKDILGIELSETSIINLLSPLGFKIARSKISDNVLNVTIPSFRTDVFLPEDILEEIGRSFGYNKFPKTLPSEQPPVQKENFLADYETFAREFLAKNLLVETTGYTLVSEEDLKNAGFNKEDCLKVLHPTSSDFVYLRPSLLINGLKALKINEERKESGFFEIAKQFETSLDNQTKLPTQKTALVLSTNFSYFKLKGTVEDLLSFSEVDLTQSEIENRGFFKQGVEFLSNGTVVAVLGTPKSNIEHNFGLQNTSFATINFEYLSTIPFGRTFTARPKYPPIIEDISFFVSAEIHAEQIERTLKNAHPLIANLSVVDVYEKGQKHSLTIRVNFLSQKKTLTSLEVSQARNSICKLLEKKFQAKIRVD